jgi:uncharacterized protein (DUF58 family)
VASEQHERHAFPLVTRRRLAGLPFGALNSVRRGSGSDVAGSRPYVPGDDVATIDWRASAKRSSAHDSDEFVVRERFAEEAPRVVVVCDRRPAMGLYEPPLPWLRKPLALLRITEMIAESAIRARGMVGYLDLAGGAPRGGPAWIPPATAGELWQIEQRAQLATPFDAPEDGLQRSFVYLAEFRRDLPAGTFVFLLSDFLACPPIAAWIETLAYGWDLIPVVIQDPVWEQSFPELPSLVVPVLDPDSGRVALVRLSTREARRRQAENEQRRRRLLRDFDALGLVPVLVDSDDPEEILRSFIAWAEARLEGLVDSWW